MMAAMARPLRCMVRNPVTELIFGPENFEQAGIRDGQRFRVRAHEQVIKGKPLLEKCK